MRISDWSSDVCSSDLAEDAVQDTFGKWQAADRRAIETPRAWLTTVCTRRCLDLLKAADRSRVDYVGPWLPEPVQTAAADAPAELAARSEEHTSELQSLMRISYAVFCLKKKKKEKTYQHTSLQTTRK